MKRRTKQEATTKRKFKSFRSELVGTRQCVVDSGRCDRDGRILSGCGGYGPQMVYAALATRATAYLPGRCRVVNGVRAINSQYAFHVAPQHHPTWAGVLDGVGYGMYVVEIKEAFLAHSMMDVVDLSCMEHVRTIGSEFCTKLLANRIIMPPNVQRIGSTFLYDAKIRCPVDLSSMRLLRKVGYFCTALKALAFTPPPNIEEAEYFLCNAKIQTPVDLSSMRLLRKVGCFCTCLKAPAFIPPPNVEDSEYVLCNAKIQLPVDLSPMRHLRRIGFFCTRLEAPGFIPPPNVEEAESFLFGAQIQSTVDLSSMKLLKKCGNYFCKCLEAHAFIPPPNVEETESFLFEAKIQTPVDLSSMRLLSKRGEYFCAFLKAPAVTLPPFSVAGGPDFFTHN